MNQQLWNTLTQAKLVSGDIPIEREPESPWYVKILLAFSGWLAATFLLGFFFTLFSQLYKNIPLSLGIGSTLIVSAFFLLKIKSNEFVEHLALAVSLAGQILILLGIDRYFHDYAHVSAITWLIVACIQLILAYIMPNTVHRVASSFTAGVGFAAALFYYQGNLSMPILYTAVLMLMTAWLWLNEFNYPKHIEKIRAIAYGLVLALITLNVTKIFTPYGILDVRYTESTSLAWFQPWMGELLFSAVTLYVVWTLLKKQQPTISNQTLALALIGTLLLSLLSLQASGLVVGVMVILLGFSASNRILIGLGVLSLLFFISHYYYALDNTLMDKAITLFILGSALLGARWFLHKRNTGLKIGEIQ